MFDELKAEVKKYEQEIKKMSANSKEFTSVAEKLIAAKKNLIAAKTKYLNDSLKDEELSLRKKRNHLIFQAGGVMEKYLKDITQTEEFIKEAMKIESLKKYFDAETIIKKESTAEQKQQYIKIESKNLTAAQITSLKNNHFTENQGFFIHENNPNILNYIKTFGIMYQIV